MRSLLPRSAYSSSRGVALLITLLVVVLLSAIGLGLLLATASERLTSANYVDSVEALNAADAALELAARELARIPDWNPVLEGTLRSGLTDDVAAGPRSIGGFAFNLITITNQLTCARTPACSDAQVRTSSAERPWGSNNPRWQLFLHGPLRLFAPAAHPLADAYVVVWIGDDAREVDGNPFVDGGGAGGEGRDVVRARAESFAAGGSRRAIEADLVRQEGGIHVQSWRVPPASIP
jgi:type II secretory pathway pseudopilin PulG